MADWYYARGGQQVGPVSLGQIVELCRNGGLDIAKDLVWNSKMKDWLPAGQVPELLEKINSVAAIADPLNPYAAPNSSWDTASQITTGVALEEIPPGSEPLDVGACVKRGFDLSVRNIGLLLAVTVLLFVITYAASALQVALTSGSQSYTTPTPLPSLSSDEQFLQTFSQSFKSTSLIGSVIQQLVSVFLALGTTRIALNLVSGKQATIGMLFSGGKKLLPAMGAMILYSLMVVIGCLFLIVPGVYLAVRFGYYMAAMVDKDMGVMQAFTYSSTLTTNHRMNLFLLGLISFAILVAGILALCIGVIFAYPVIMLSWIVAYRWMQYGHRAALDHPGTQIPMLSKL